MTPRDLALCTGARIDRATEWLPAIVDAMREFSINTPARQAMFLAQIGHESGGLHFLIEIWGPTDAQKRYEGRADLGNNQPGDGFKFRGRSFIQITGRANYKAVERAFLVDVIAHPELLAQTPFAARASAWWWKNHGLNELADTGSCEACTRRINGGLNGLDDRKALLEVARGVLAPPPAPEPMRKMDVPHETPLVKPGLFASLSEFFGQLLRSKK